MSISKSGCNWTHKPWCRPSDPINVIFREIDLDEVERFLLSEGWKKLPWPHHLFAHSHVIPDPDPLNKRKQNRQLVKGGIYKRFHIRLWKLSGEIIAGVHFDRIRGFGHSITDFESIEKCFAKLCKKNLDWEVLEDVEDLNNHFAGHGEPYNNGKATVIRRKK